MTLLTLYAKMAMSDLQRYPRNLNLFKIVEDTVVLLKSVNSDDFVVASVQVTLAEKPQMQTNKLDQIKLLITTVKPSLGLKGGGSFLKFLRGK